MMADHLPHFFMAIAFILLFSLSIIDLKTFLLPNPLVFAFGVTGLSFQLSTEFYYIPLQDMAIGALAGGGILFAIRCFGNHLYQQDTLGLGDIKLMAAAGLWLGFDGVMAAITLGAFAGVLHGVGLACWRAVKHRHAFSLKKLMIPAGPGFAVGIILTGLWMFRDLFV